jgi:hypothetical protein
MKRAGSRLLRAIRAGSVTPKALGSIASTRPGSETLPMALAHAMPI